MHRRCSLMPSLRTGWPNACEIWMCDDASGRWSLRNCRSNAKKRSAFDWLPTMFSSYHSLKQTCIQTAVLIKPKKIANGMCLLRIWIKIIIYLCYEGMIQVQLIVQPIIRCSFCVCEDYGRHEGEDIYWLRTHLHLCYICRLYFGFAKLLVRTSNAFFSQDLERKS